MIIENYQKLVCQTYSLAEKISTPKKSCDRPTHFIPVEGGFSPPNVWGTCRAPGLLKHKKVASCERSVGAKTPGWFARHLKFPCVLLTMKTRRCKQLEKKPYCKWWNCTCRPHWYLCIFVVCIDAVCIDACIPGGDHQMSCFVVCYFHNWDFDNRPIGSIKTSFGWYTRWRSEKANICSYSRDPLQFNRVEGWYLHLVNIG